MMDNNKMDTLMEKLFFNKPVKKNKCYLSRLNNKVSYTLNNCIIKTFFKTSIGYSINILLNDNDTTFFKEIDNLAIYNIMKNNNEWFENSLLDEEIKHLFKPSYCCQNNILKAQILFTKEPEIIINNISNNNMEDIIKILSNPLILKKYNINIKLNHLGLFFYPHESINKWIINTIILEDIDTNDNNDWSKNEIDADWTIIGNNSILDIDKKILELNSTKNNIINNLINIKNIENPNEKWENEITDLKKNIKNILSINDNR